MNTHTQPEQDASTDRRQECVDAVERLLYTRTLIIASNRGPVTLERAEDGSLEFQRGGGGLVTALIGLAQQVETFWIASAMTAEDREWGRGKIPIVEGGNDVSIEFVPVDEEAYEGYYNVISNPLLWFLQHSMWDFVSSPTINLETWKAWDGGYVHVNNQFAQSIARQVRNSENKALIMLQDYHLYLAPRMIREELSEIDTYTLVHFIHIPWPGSEEWGMVPYRMRHSILDGLTAVDLLGFQTREDGLNFIRTCESMLDAEVSFTDGWVRYRGRKTYVRDFPISIDVQALHRLGDSEEVIEYRKRLENRLDGYRLILRVDRTEPSKNIVRGFMALDEMLQLHPEHIGKIQFWAYLVPSRLEVEEYQDYLDELMAAAGRVNARHGDGEWEPVRVVVGENYPRAVAAMQLYDVLLVNSIADGMNLVAKEGPSVNQRDGVVILSERTGAHQQLKPSALIISPCDVHDTAEALHHALTMPAAERHERAVSLREIVEREDIADWLCRQFEAIQELGM